MGRPLDIGGWEGRGATTGTAAAAGITVGAVTVGGIFGLGVNSVCSTIFFASADFAADDGLVAACGLVTASGLITLFGAVTSGDLGAALGFCTAAVAAALDGAAGGFGNALAGSGFGTGAFGASAFGATVFGVDVLGADAGLV